MTTSRTQPPPPTAPPPADPAAAGGTTVAPGSKARAIVIMAALFFGALSYGGLVINQSVPKELVEVLTALVILFAICAQQIMTRAARGLR